MGQPPVGDLERHLSNRTHRDPSTPLRSAQDDTSKTRARTKSKATTPLKPTAGLNGPPAISHRVCTNCTRQPVGGWKSDGSGLSRLRIVKLRSLFPVRGSSVTERTIMLSASDDLHCSWTRLSGWPLASFVPGIASKLRSPLANTPLIVAVPSSSIVRFGLCLLAMTSPRC